ncbi:MAG: MobA/MobL family protein [Butyrivibrio sp.]|uniref:MobQ family relaxase n=1 Tax=Butyrivibrio sp. TaxID=28121 RepID=UPI001B2B2998|nr:MobQ family relaxase [Butyrivibrio sp.]MBO6241566.1 MobA/MobL family protein [Butyrivibrio sp.]
MSIYHCSIKIIGRNGGRSAVSAAAYRSGEKLYSNETGLIHDYTRKGGVVMNEIILPDNAPARLLDREILWNEVQQVEKRTDAQFAREVEVALPYELTREEQLECVRGFIKENFTSKGMIADWALHDKGDGNPHAHIMLTVREINEEEGWQLKQRSVFANGRDENGKPIYDPSKPSYNPNDREKTSQYRIPVLDENGNQKTRVRQGKGTEYLWERISIPANDWNEHSKCEQWRKSWAEHCNHYLSPEIHIDHRSYERQGLDIEPTVHEGVTARKMEKNGKVSDRCEINREIRQRNMLRQKIADEFSELSKNILSKARYLYGRITGILTKEKSRRAAKDSREAGIAGLPVGGITDGERISGTVGSTPEGSGEFPGETAIRGTDGDKRKRGRSGRADGIKQQLEQRKLEAPVTDKRIAELKRLKTEKENTLNERIRKLMEYRGSGIEDGSDAKRERKSDLTPKPERGADTAALIRDIRNTISSAGFKERTAEKERSDRDTKRRRLDLERKRNAERERQAAIERIEQNKKRSRDRGPSL